MNINKIKLYFKHLLVSIILFLMIQFINLIIQIFSIIILIFGIIGIGIWYKSKKQGEEDGSS